MRATAAPLQPLVPAAHQSPAGGSSDMPWLALADCWFLGGGCRLKTVLGGGCRLNKKRPGAPPPGVQHGRADLVGADGERRVREPGALPCQQHGLCCNMAEVN